jgi:DNA-binding LacI/PurR family transcriptional regulator/DNA-binding transcriptional regulator YhcF (GntR family)
MLKTQTISEQVASHLRDELKRGRWKGLMPGRDRLAVECGVNGATIERALSQLEREGILKSQGVGKRRRITLSKQKSKARMRLAAILYEREDPSLMRYHFELSHMLHPTGHDLGFAPKTLVELKQDPKRIQEMVRDHPADAWIIQAGSRPVLEWFARSSFPTFALFGRMQDLPIAGVGVNKPPAVREAVRHLIEQGHERIVMLTREERRVPNYGPNEQVLLDELKANGISAGSFNIPSWKETGDGFHKCLEELFRVTPPSAIMVDDGILFLALQNYLAQERGQALRKVALICTDYHPSFEWCRPPIPHIQWDYAPILRRVVRWVNQVARGKDDRKQSRVRARFVGGDLIR